MRIKKHKGNIIARIRQRQAVAEHVAKVERFMLLRDVMANNTPDMLRTLELTQYCTDFDPVVRRSAHFAHWLEVQMPNGAFVPVTYRDGRAWVLAHEMQMVYPEWANMATPNHADAAH